MSDINDEAEASSVGVKYNSQGVVREFGQQSSHVSQGYLD